MPSGWQCRRRLPLAQQHHLGPGSALQPGRLQTICRVDGPCKRQDRGIVRPRRPLPEGRRETNCRKNASINTIKGVHMRSHNCACGALMPLAVAASGSQRSRPHPPSQSRAPKRWHGNRGCSRTRFRLSNKNGRADDGAELASPRPQDCHQRMARRHVLRGGCMISRDARSDGTICVSTHRRTRRAG